MGSLIPSFLVLLGALCSVGPGYRWLPLYPVGPDTFVPFRMESLMTPYDMNSAMSP